MAVFNPEQQAQPSYPYFWARPTSEPKPDVSGKIQGEALGDALKGAAGTVREGTQAATAAYEKGIQNSIYAQVDPLRDQFMESLHTADKALRPGQDVPDPLGRDAPRDVKQLPQTLNTLDSARANGKLSQTDYDARLNTIAKDIRAKYPGFRQYVDEEFKRITGRDSANQYIRSVIQDIDSFIAAKGAKRDKLESELWSNLKYDGAGDMLKLYKSNPEKYAGTALDFIATAKNKDYHDQKYAQDLATMEREHTLTAQGAKDKFDAWVDTTGSHAWSLNRTSLSIQGGDQSFTELGRQMQGGEPVQFKSEEQKQQLAGVLFQLGESKKVQRAKELADIGGSSITPEQIQKTVDEEYKTYWKPYVDRLTDGKWGEAASVHRQMDGIKNDATKALISRPEFKEYLGMIGALKEQDPNLATQILQNPLLTKMPDSLAAYTATNLSNLSNPTATNPKTLTQVMNESRTKNIDDGGVYKAPLDLVAEIGKKGPDAISPEAKRELAKRAFGPDSSKFLEMFANDHFTAEPGKPLSLKKVLGRQSIFNTFTSEGMMNELYKLGKDDPSLWQNYTNWVGNNIKSLLTDHSTQLTPPGSPGMPRHFPVGGGDQPIHADFDDSSSTFTFRMGDRSVMNRADLHNLSNNIKVISEIAKKNKTDPDVGILSLLQSMNPEPGSMIENMIKAMVTARQKKDNVAE